jgi:hypothetical protein
MQRGVDIRQDQAIRQGPEATDAAFEGFEDPEESDTLANCLVLSYVYTTLHGEVAEFEIFMVAVFRSHDLAVQRGVDIRQDQAIRQGPEATDAAFEGFEDPEVQRSILPAGVQRSKMT